MSRNRTDIRSGRNFGSQGRLWLAIVLLGSIANALGLVSVIARAQEPAQNSAVPQDTATAGQRTDGQRTDGQIEMDVVHALDAAPALTPDWITAGTVQGEVTLSGTSSSDANRQLAESIVKKVPGVTKVVNSLKVGDPQTAQGQDPSQAQDNAQDSGQAMADDQTGNQPVDQGSQQAENQGANQNQGPNQPAYQPGPQAGPQYGPRPQYRAGQGQPPPPQYAQTPEPPHDPVTLAQGTLLKVRTSESLNSKRAKDGTPVEFTVMRDVYAAGVLAIPRGATVHGQVIDVKKSGALGGSPELALKIDSLDMGGKSYGLDATPFAVRGPNKAGRTAGNAFGGAILGAIIGGAVGGGSGAAIGAGAGAVGGTAASAASPGPQVWIPAEAPLDFHLNTALTVTPVSWQEAQRLASNAPPPSQRPTLYRRGYYNGYPPPPPPPGYYYRPY